MKKINFLSLILTLLLTISAFSTARAQEQVQDEDQNPDKVERPFRIMQELGLTPEQVQQIRRINQERKPIMQEAQRRWKTARRDLDLAVYADDSTEEQVKNLTKTAQLAQADLLKERTLTEYLIRKVLTSEQLVKFRSLREGLMQRRNERRNMNQDIQNKQRPPRPDNRFQRRNPNRQP